ncbi:DUF3872 domain-containing protein [Flavobacterium pisciphilum]
MMKAIFNRFKIGLLPVLMLSLTLLSCQSDELQIQHNFPFEVKTMPVPAGIAHGKTVEIRITIERDGNYAGAQYFLRYFQFEGKGTLRYYEDAPYLPNDLYQLPQERFRLYYTSESLVSQSFDVWISDNFGNEKKLTFEFSNSD